MTQTNNIEVTTESFHVRCGQVEGIGMGPAGFLSWKFEPEGVLPAVMEHQIHRAEIQHPGAWKEKVGAKRGPGLSPAKSRQE